MEHQGSKIDNGLGWSVNNEFICKDKCPAKTKIGWTFINLSQTMDNVRMDILNWTRISMTS
jgi:hypothetical protein